MTLRSVDGLTGLRAARWIPESAPGQFDRYGPEAAQIELQDIVELIEHEATVREDPPPAEEPLSADPDDEYLLDLARAGLRTYSCPVTRTCWLCGTLYRS